MKDDVITIGNGLELEIWPLGARLNRVRYGGLDCVDGSLNREEALGAKRYNGAVVGPVANRLAGGSVEIDGKTFVLPRNENNETTLHGGPEGVHALDWQVQEADDDNVKLVLDLSNGFGGLPGNRRLTATYRVNPNDFTLTFEATTDATTYMNLALHPYWTLDAGMRDGLDLSVNADRYTPVDAKKIPTGDIADVTGTHFDLRNLQEPSTEIDHNFCLNPGADPAVTLTANRLRLDITTDAPGMQIYSGKPTGIAIEPQHWPDAPHHANFPSILLRPGETYSQTSTYRFSRR